MAWKIYSIYNPGRILLDKGCRTHLWKPKKRQPLVGRSCTRWKAPGPEPAVTLRGSWSPSLKKKKFYPIFVGEVPNFFCWWIPPKKEQDVVLRVGLCHLDSVLLEDQGYPRRLLEGTSWDPKGTSGIPTYLSLF